MTQAVAGIRVIDMAHNQGAAVICWRFHRRM
jgi:hypothetical protein